MSVSRIVVLTADAVFMVSVIVIMIVMVVAAATTVCVQDGIFVVVNDTR